MVSRISPTRSTSAHRTIILILALAALALLAWYLWARTRPPGPLLLAVTLAGEGPKIASSSLSDPFGVAVDEDGNIYVSDGRGGRIHRLNEEGALETIASGLDMPSGVALAPDGTLIVAETGVHTISRIDLKTGSKSIIAGAPGESGEKDGAGAEARFNAPVGVAVDDEGNIFVADTYNDRLRLIARDARVTTIAGGEWGYSDGTGAEARFDTPCGITIAPDGALIVADTGNHRLRRVTRDGIVTTLAGTGEAMSRDGALQEAAFSEPVALAFRRDGALAVADAASSSLRLVTFGEQPQVRTLAGGYPNGLDDGELDTARLNRPTGVAFAPEDELVFADSASGMLRALLPRGVERGRESAPERLILPASEIRAAVAPRWPYDPPEARREVAGTFGEVRGEVMAEHDAWFHSGLDVPGAYGEMVRAVFSERVTLPLAVEGVGGLRERLRLPLFGYIHLRVGRDANDRMLPGVDARDFELRRDDLGKVIGVRVRRGARIAAGAPLGTLNRLNHVHLVAGPPAAEVNALSALRLPGLSDTVPPVIEEVVLTDSSGATFGREGEKGREMVTVSGRARIIVRAYDQMDGNASYRRLGPYRLGYQVLSSSGEPAPGFEQRRETIVFERLPEDRGGVALVYAEGSQSGYEGRTIFAYVVTNVVRDGAAREEFWDAGSLGAGEYIVRVFVADYHGNEARRDLRVRVR